MRKLQLLLIALLALPIGMLAQGLTWQSAEEIELGGSASGSLEQGKDNAWFKVTTTEDGQLSFTISSQTALKVNYIEICTLKEDGSDYANRNTTWVNADNNSVTAVDAAPGTYYLHVNRSSGNGTFTVTSAFTKNTYTNDNERNDTWDKAVEKDINSEWLGHLGYRYDGNYTDNDDWFKVTTTEDGELSFTIPSETTLNINYIEICTLMKDGSNYSNRNTTWVNAENKTVTAVDAAPGTYYLHVNRSSGYGGYKIQCAFTKNSYTNDNEGNDTWDKAVSKDINSEWFGHLGYRYDSSDTDNDDWFKVTTTEDGELSFTIPAEETLSVNYIEICTLMKDGSSYSNRKTTWVNADNKTVTAVDATPGTYYLHVNRSSGYGGYKIQCVFKKNAYTNDDEGNDTWDKAVPKDINSEWFGHLGYRYDSSDTDNDDWFKVTTTEDGELSFTIPAEETLSVNYIEICTLKEDGSGYSNRNTTWVNADNKTVTAVDAAPGNYYLHVNRSSGYGGYKIKCTFKRNPALDEEPNDTWNQAQALTDGQKRTANLGYRYDGNYTDNNDWWKIDIPGNGKVTLVATAQEAYPLRINYMEFCVQNDDGSDYNNRATRWFSSKSDTLIITDVAKGTYYIHLNRSSEYGTYNVRCDFSPNRYGLDAEPNDKYEEATETILNDESKEGHLGYRYSNDTDNSDWYNLKVGSAGFLRIFLQIDSTSTLNLSYVELCRKDGSNVHTDWLSGQKTMLLTYTDLEEGDYMLHLNRSSGEGGYKLFVGSPQRAAGSQIRISFIGNNSVRLGVPSEYTVKVENISDEVAAPFIVAIPASEDIRLLGAKLPGNDGVTELTLDEITYDGADIMWFLVPRMDPYQQYSFNIIAEGLTMAGARDIEKTIKPLAITTTMLVVAALGVAYDIVEDQFTSWCTEVISENIDLSQKELDQYRQVVGSGVDQMIVEEQQKSGILVQAARPTVKKICTNIISKLPGGPLINAVGDAVEVLKSLSGALRRRLWYWIYKDLGYIKEEHPAVLDAKVGCNKVVRSWDPNEMVGPVGVGAGNYIPETRTMDYRILFENKKEATAPAYRVQITNDLDENIFDISSVKFGSTSHDGEGYNWNMQQDGNRLYWDIKGIELQPNVNAPEGEGYVTFSVNLKPGLKNGTEIKNKATIIFDVNEPIETNEYLNTLDLNEPTTEMVSATEKDGSVIITCNGNDGESGVSHYQYFASYNGADYLFIGDDTSSEFTYTLPTGTKATDYMFYAVAVDNVGNTQQIAPTAISTTGIREISYEALDGSGWTVYTLKGVKVAQGEGQMQLSLPAGVYVIRSGNTTRKVIIK